MGGRAARISAGASAGTGDAGLGWALFAQSVVHLPSGLVCAVGSAFPTPEQVLYVGRDPQHFKY